MASKLKPWMRGPWELIKHGDGHREQGEDFDKRMALISYDNAIEVSITTYLELHPAQRGGRTYEQKEVEQWKKNFHTRLDFLEAHFREIHATPISTRDTLIWYHALRNSMYHSGNGMVPEEYAVDGARQAALEIFSLLFDVHGIEFAGDPLLARSAFLESHWAYGDRVLLELAKSYNKIRDNHESGAVRSQLLTEVAGSMKRAAQTIAYDRLATQKYLSSSDGGLHLLGLILTKVHGDVDLFPEVVEVIAGSLSAFEQYYALWTVHDLFPRLSRAQRLQLKDALNDPGVLSNIGGDGSRSVVRDRLLSMINGDGHLWDRDD